MGFVNIPGRTVYPGDNGQTIVEYIEWFRDYADEQKTALQSAIDDLEAVVGVYNPDDSTVDIEMPSIDGPSFPVKPNWGDLVLDSNWPNAPATPVLKEYGNTDFEYVAPTPPSDISNDFDWTASEYTSEMWTALFNKVYSDILNGGTGLTDAVHTIIVSREQEARRINQDREFQAGLDATGETGFNLPSGHVTAFMAEFQREVMQRDQDALNNITVKDFDLAQTNTHFAISTGAELEKMLRDTFNQSELMSLEAAKAASEFLVSVYNANIQAYIAKWEGIKAKLEALKIKIEAIATENDGKIKVYVAQSQAYETEIKAISDKNNNLVDARKTEVETYGIEVEAIAKQYDALVAEVGAQVETARLEVEQAIENAKVNLDAYTAQSALAEKVAEEIALIGAQSVASALGGVNTSLSNAHHDSVGITEHWGHSESIGESHDYTEK